MTLVLILAVLGFFLNNPTEAAVPELPPDLARLETYLQQQETKVQSLEQRLAQQETKGQSLEQRLNAEIGKWPPGHYCILASGSCPAGFSRHAGHMRALRQYAASPAYITPTTFGDSKIECHGPCGYYGQWVGELYITACCK